MQSNELINDISIFIENKIPEKYLTKFQEILLASGIFTVASELLAIMILSILILSILFSLISIIFAFDILICILFAFFIPPGILTGVIISKSEKRAEKIENASPNF